MFAKVHCNIHDFVLQDVISSFRQNRARPPPFVPLCRLVVNEAIRTVKEDIPEFLNTFRDYGYLRELGIFLVSSKRISQPDLEVTQYDLDQWGPIWREVNDEFEQDLAGSEEWAHLSNKKFIIWDGNHRAQAWMRQIHQG